MPKCTVPHMSIETNHKAEQVSREEIIPYLCGYLKPEEAQRIEELSMEDDELATKIRTMRLLM